MRIPDITERYPEGYGGIDTLDPDSKGYEPTYEQEDEQTIDEIYYTCRMSKTFEKADRDLQGNYLWKTYPESCKHSIYNRQQKLGRSEFPEILEDEDIPF